MHSAGALARPSRHALLGGRCAFSRRSQTHQDVNCSPSPTATAGCAFLLPPVVLTALAAPSSGAVTLKRVQPFSACTGVWNLPNFSVPAQLSFCPTLVSEVGHLAPAAPHDLAMAHRLAGTLGASPCDAPTPQTTSGASTASCAATPLRPLSPLLISHYYIDNDNTC